MKFVALLALLLLAACGSSTTTASRDLGQAKVPQELRVTSTAFANNAAIPRGNTCDGAGTAPPLQFSGVPANTKSVAVVVDDPDATTKGPFVHWVVIGLPPRDGTVVTTGSGVHELDNTGGTRGWTPPCPPPGKTHHYRFTVYALRDYVCDVGADDVPQPGCSPPAAADALGQIADAAIAKGTLVGTYRR